MQADKKKEVHRVVRASVIGATIEWYDFFLYGVIAGLVFNKLYFPSGDPFIGTMLAYATFAIGFLARPLGGIIFGHIGDKVSRKGALIATLILMGVSTFAIGLIPSYESIGIWAPILLLICRVMQGIGLGGEWGGAVLMAYEYAPKEKRGLYASWPQVGLSLSLCLAPGVSALPALYLMTAHVDSTWIVWLSIIIPFGILYASVYGPEAALFCELFDTDVRYTGISFVYQFSGIFASGITPMIATALLHANDNQPWYVASYVVFAGLVSALSAWSIHRSKKRDHIVATPTSIRTKATSM